MPGRLRPPTSGEAAVALVGVAVLAIGMAVLFAGGPPPAPPRPLPAPAPAAVAAILKHSATMYRGIVEEDARRFALPRPAPEALAAVIPYADELGAAQAIRAGGTLQTAHLRLSLVVRREQGASGLMQGQLFRADQLVLTIENRTDRHLAYRVATRLGDPSRCEAKGDLPHNAIALAPRQTVSRTECLFDRSGRVEVTRAEVMELAPLSYHYVSRLTPELILYDPRTAAGHAAPKGNPCPQTFSWREIRDGAERGQIAWRDIIDFYARHNCDDYAFFAGYRYRADPVTDLPVKGPNLP